MMAFTAAMHGRMSRRLSAAVGVETGRFVAAAFDALSRAAPRRLVLGPPSKSLLFPLASGQRGRFRHFFQLAIVLLLLGANCPAQSPTPPVPPASPTLNISFGEDPGKLGLSMQILLLMTLLTLLPAAIASLTPFLRILVVLHFLRQAVGTQTAPSNQTLIGLTLFLTVVLMQPVADEVHAQAIVPLQQEEINHFEALQRAGVPIKKFLSRYVRENDIALFLEITGKPRPTNLDELELMVLMPAYVLSELKTAFQIGAVLFLPFLVIDLLVASITLSLGMIQLPPIMISAPFKLLLFVLVDGWNLVVGSLVKGFY